MKTPQLYCILTLWLFPSIVFSQEKKLKPPIGFEVFTFINSCGTTFNDLNGLINAGAFNPSGQIIEAYDFEFKSVTGTLLGVQRVSETQNNGERVTVALSRFPFLVPGNTYQVRARAIFSSISSSYSNSCEIHIATVSPVNIQTQDCNRTIPISGLGSITFTAETVASASAYIFGVFGESGVLLGEYRSTSNTVGAGVLPGLIEGNSYTIKVKADVRGAVGAYGDGCTLNIESTFLPRILPQYCGQTYNDLSATLEAEDVFGGLLVKYIFGLFDESGTVLLSEYSSLGLGDRTIQLLSFNNIELNKQYVIKVRIFSKFGNGIDDYGPGCSISTGEETLNTPVNFVASGISSAEALLTWKDESGIETGYVIERKLVSGGAFQQLVELPANTEKYIDPSLSPESSYIYRVYAQGSNGNSDYSNEVTVTTKEYSILYPNGGEIYFAEQPLPIGWVGFPITIERQVSLHAVNITSGSEWELITTEDDGTFKSNIPQNLVGQFKLEIRTLAGEVLDESNEPFTILENSVKPTTALRIYLASFKHTPDEHLYETRGDSLRFHFEERYKHEGLVEACIYNWKRQKIVDLPLEAMIGRNAYALNVSNRGLGLALDSCYSLEIEYNDGHKGFIRFKRTEAIPLEAEIEMDVIVANCELASANDILFTCQASEGSEPYMVTWYLSDTPNENDARRVEVDRYSNDPLIYTSSASIDSKSDFRVLDLPNYYIIMHVRDACGEEVRKVVRVQCETPNSPDSQISIEIIDIQSNQG